MTKEIDNYAERELGISKMKLMQHAGMAVANSVRSYCDRGARISIFAGKGNNGGDGYAAARYLKDDYRVTVYDVFSAGQKSDEGKYFLDAFSESNGRIEPLTFDEKQMAQIAASDCIVDAVFGTGFFGELPLVAIRLIDLFASLDKAIKIAIDAPLGIDADLGRVIAGVHYEATATVVLGAIKTGLVSYPAREYLGKLIYDNIGLQEADIFKRFEPTEYYIDRELASTLIPKRRKNSNKGNFGRLLVAAGSEEYEGAAHLSLEAAFRSGVGYVTFCGKSQLCDSLIRRLPEVIYKPIPSFSRWSDHVDLRNLNAVLIGPGCSGNDDFHIFLNALLERFDGYVVIDADAINMLAKDPKEGRAKILRSGKAILTPHPLELSRLSGASVDEIQNNRLEFAKKFARDNNCILVLKGAGTIVTDGYETYINSSGSSALAKAGSGDVLAGHLSGLVAIGMDPLKASALAVYLHGLAADELAAEFSEFGVIPSDLPREIARQIAYLIRQDD